MHEGDPTDALSVLADETRIAILRALADAEEALSFTELRRRASVEDAGRFNYHLTKLCEYFVREVDGGYALGHAGSRIVATAEGVDAAAAAADADVVSEAVVDPDGADEGDAVATTCPVCGDDGCERLFHVHLSVPWR